MTSPEWRWYEPQHAVLGGKEYFTHAWGSIYVLSGSTALHLAQMPAGLMRFFANEGRCCWIFTLHSPMTGLVASLVNMSVGHELLSEHCAVRACHAYILFCCQCLRSDLRVCRCDFGSVDAGTECKPL